MSDVDRIFAGIARWEALTQGATVCGPSWHAVVLDGSLDVLGNGGGSVTGECDMVVGEALHVAANDPSHVLAVLAAAREELADAVAQQARHGQRHDRLCWGCVEYAPCGDAQQADRTIARLLALYDGDT